MIVLSYLQKHNVNIPFSFGKELGFGADGQVFEFDKDKVVKFSVQYKIDKYEETLKKFEYLKQDNPLFAKVYEANYLFGSHRFTINGEQKYLVYYSIMEKLNPLTIKEMHIAEGLLAGDDIPEEYRYFYQLLTNCPVNHNDLHYGNVMKDNFGTFKLIDFDRMTL